MFNNNQQQKGQARQALQQARSIINQMKQSEQRNADMARQLSDVEVANELGITQGNANPQIMAQREANAANQLKNFAKSEQNATQQLNQLDQILNQLESQLR